MAFQPTSPRGEPEEVLTRAGSLSASYPAGRTVPLLPGTARLWWAVPLCHNGPMPSRDAIFKALEAVVDPELRQDIVTLGMVRSVEASPEGRVAGTVSLTTPGCPIRNHFQTAVVQSVRAVDGVSGVDVSFNVPSDAEKGALQRKLGRGGLPEGALAQVS